MENGSSPYSGISELADAEQGLTKYYSNIVELIIAGTYPNRNSPSELSILEFGAGTGFLSELLQDTHSCKVECLEIDQTLIGILIAKGFETYSCMESIQKKYDLVFSSNVLEHIENDTEAITQLRKILKPNGKLVTYVPAFPLLFSDLDRAVGHFRRYTKKDLNEKMSSCGLEVEKIHYVDSLGFPASLLLRMMGYRSRGNIGGLTSMKIYDRYFFPLSRQLDRLGLKYLLGKNIIVYASLRK